MLEGPVADATIWIDAQPDDVWIALTDPARIRRYLFGADVRSDWRTGSPIRWSGEYAGRRFEDHGEVIEAAPGVLLEYRHVSGTAKDGGDDLGHIVRIDLAGEDGGTRVTLRQDGAADVAAREHAEANWRQVLAGLKDVVEGEHGVSTRR
ncbi:SRPBCC family protein [Arenimonas composti]|uniref:Activator of Hsp90 ATPase homologue 1/2-like C-terminal domain-containing protein n=1 Tax=Arenimonas composti TR7-09 = DSM 18010 TaxID=1121013 RepID=A0A091BD48_9GAMM|nr:SRPBCC family protein [Arenimonas composti]KFN49666.1 hypothetical protein P873_09875 [Arenimonas composti TR7-09 = DSM 18010]